MHANTMGKHKNYPHKRRFCAIVDRREDEHETDDLTFFEPPQNCCAFPEHKEGHVQLWHFEASRTCILPDKGYARGEHQANALTSMTACAMTLSFHAESVDEIRCYLFVNGGMMRFMPQDIISILPKLFDPEFSDNAEWANKAKGLVEKMAAQLTDPKFDAFYKSCFEV